MAPWEYYYANNDWVKEMNDSWTANVFQVYVQLARTEISWKLIILAATGAVSLTMLTVSFQTIRAANLNPVNSLKTE